MSMRKDRSHLQPLVLVLIYLAQGSLASNTTHTSEQSLSISNSLQQLKLSRLSIDEHALLRCYDPHKEEGGWAEKQDGSRISDSVPSSHRAAGWAVLPPHHPGALLPNTWGEQCVPDSNSLELDRWAKDLEGRLFWDSICFLCFPSNLALLCPQLGFILIPMTFTMHTPSTAQSSTPFWFLPTTWDSYHSAKTGNPPKLDLFCEVSRSPPTAGYLFLSSSFHSTRACAITAIKQTLFTNLSTPLDGEPGRGLTDAWQTDQWIALRTIPVLGRCVVHGGDRCGNNTLHNKECTHM